MKLRASIACSYEDPSSARAIAMALRPDNLQAPKGIGITTRVRGKRVITEVKVDGEIETLLATLDDLLACTLTAEGVI